MKISLIIPSRNNLKYLKWAYESIRKNQGKHVVQICVADDASVDGTWQWCQDRMEADEHFKAIRNEGPDRQGLVILNDKLINEVAEHDLAMVYHADMYLCPGALDAIEHHMFSLTADGFSTAMMPVKKTIVSLTRIEPSLHPPGPEKILLDAGLEPEDFDEDIVTKYLNKSVSERHDKITEGIFAPWAFWKEEFQEIGGHDILFAPQSKEDSDIFNRFHLNGIKFIQTWKGCVYHMTSRGSRFNTFSGGAPGKNSNEWMYTTTRNTKEFIRKWGHVIKHDPYMKPIVPPKYDIGIKINNTTNQLLEVLEPWCTSMYTDINFDSYIEKIQPDTSFNIRSKMCGIEEDVTNDVVISIDGLKFTEQDMYYIQEISSIIADNGEIGQFELGNLHIEITDLRTWENELIVCER